MTTTHGWIDASAGIAGDMLLAALVDAGADLRVIQDAVDQVVPAATRLESRQVSRAGMRATKINVRVLVDELPHRRWLEIRRIVDDAALRAEVKSATIRVFSRLAEAEARAHGGQVDKVHFHELGALDSIADIVGVCAAVHDLGIDSLAAGPVALGAGHVESAHGIMPIPAPAVVELARGWPVAGVERGELTTPTGMALLTALATPEETLPPITLYCAGIGAGTADRPGRANVTRVLIGSRFDAISDAPSLEPVVCLEANVDDQDPRLWPGALARLLSDGADDAWLVPIIMKKGRPAHTLTVLCRPELADRLTDVMLSSTSSLGVRRSVRGKYALPRTWFQLDVDGVTISVKVAYRRDEQITHVVPEFDDVFAAATALDLPAREVLARTQEAAYAVGLRVGVHIATIPLPRKSAPFTRLV